MSLQDTPSAERTHIGFFGCTNAGKSSLVNAVTSQPLSVVSDVHGTTTDPVRKAMEILPLGPVVIIDTPGFDDVSALGALRVEKMKQVLDESDIAVLVADAAKGLTADDRELLAMIRARQLPHLIVYSKADLHPGRSADNVPVNAADHPVDINHPHASPLPGPEETGCPVLYASAVTGEGIFELKELLGHMVKDEAHGRVIVRDLVREGDTVVLVCPIDESAPKGRLILPQVQTIRDLLDGGISDAVPYRFLEKQGYTRNVILLTQPKGYRKQKSASLGIMQFLLRRQPMIARAMKIRHEMYNHQMDEIDAREQSGENLVIRPGRALGIRRTENDPKELERVYQMGRQTGIDQLEAVRRFLT